MSNLEAAEGTIAADWNWDSNFKRVTNIEGAVEELMKQDELKKDVVLDSREFIVTEQGTDKALRIVPTTPQAEEWLPSAGCRLSLPSLKQLGARLSPSIPASFLQKLATTRPGRAADLINGLLADDPKRYLLRLLDNDIRGVMSDRYKIIDNSTVLTAALEGAKETNSIPFDFAITATGLRIRLINKEIVEKLDHARQTDTKWFSGGIGNQEYLSMVGAHTTEPLPGGPETVWPMITIKNDECGGSAVNMTLGVALGVCYNIATIQRIVRQYHIGGQMDAGIVSVETRSKEADLTMSKIRDGVVGTFDKKEFSKLIATMTGADTPISAPSEALGLLISKTELAATRKNDILSYWLKDYKPTSLGLASAVSRVIQDETDPSKQDILANVAGDIMTGALSLA